MSNMTYTQLKNKLTAWVEDDNAEFTGSIDDVINLGEMRLWKDLDLSIFSYVDTATALPNTATVTKSTSNVELVTWQSIYYDSGGKRIHLQLRSTDYVRDHQVPGATGSPKYYSELNETQWLLSPVPDVTYVFTCRGVARPTRLSLTNPLTWLSMHQDDLLFKACLAEAEGFLKADDREAKWEQQYVNALPLAKRETYELLASRYNLTPMEVPAVPTTQR